MIPSARLVPVVTARVRGRRFPEPGLDWARFWYNDVMLAECPLVVR
jgi:hypothetical protein